LWEDEYNPVDGDLSLRGDFLEKREVGFEVLVEEVHREVEKDLGGKK